MRRFALHLLVLLGLVALLAPTVAEGHFKGKREFYFGPITSNNDPVNMFYQPWATSKDEVDRHHKAHWRTDPQGERECANDRDAGGGDVPGDGSCDPLEKLRWHTDEQMSSRFGFCKGTDTLGFDEFGGGRVPLENDWQSVGYSTEREEPDEDIDVGPEDCLTRYHNRMGTTRPTRRYRGPHMTRATSNGWWEGSTTRSPRWCAKSDRPHLR